MLFELLAMAFVPRRMHDLAEALSSGDAQDAYGAALGAVGFGTLVSLVHEDLATLEKDVEVLFHGIRREYTRMFVGVQNPLISPYLGIWHTIQNGGHPLLFVGEESMAVEHFMRDCGVGHAKGTNDPLDHVGSVLEFMQFLCLVKSGAVLPPKGTVIVEGAFDSFFDEHFTQFAEGFGVAILENTPHSVYRANARILCALGAQ